MDEQLHGSNFIIMDVITYPYLNLHDRFPNLCCNVLKDTPTVVNDVVKLILLRDISMQNKYV